MASFDFDAAWRELFGEFESTSTSVESTSQLKEDSSSSELEVLPITAVEFCEVQLDDKYFNIDGIGFKMVFVQGGLFVMGATEEQLCHGDDVIQVGFNCHPAHSEILDHFFIAETLVTQSLWKVVMGNNPSHIKCDDNPVEQISWTDCQVFISKLNDILGPQLGNRKFSLPTEAQWEYAARGGRKRCENIVNVHITDEDAWYWRLEDSKSRNPHKVKQKQPNVLGLYDMIGNVQEWCDDADNKEGFRRLRGGGWRRNMNSLLAYSSLYYKSRYNNSGLRLVLQ